MVDSRRFLYRLRVFCDAFPCKCVGPVSRASAAIALFLHQDRNCVRCARVTRSMNALPCALRTSGECGCVAHQNSHFAKVAACCDRWFSILRYNSCIGLSVNVLLRRKLSVADFSHAARIKSAVLVQRMLTCFVIGFYTERLFCPIAYAYMYTYIYAYAIARVILRFAPVATSQLWLRARPKVVEPVV